VSAQGEGESVRVPVTRESRAARRVRVGHSSSSALPTTLRRFDCHEDQSVDLRFRLGRPRELRVLWRATRLLRLADGSELGRPMTRRERAVAFVLLLRHAT
jgi:hypothetical protein